MKIRSRWYIAMSLAVVTGALGVMATRGLARQDEAKPVTSLLPESSFLYVVWDGTDSHRESWEKTAAYESTIKSGLMAGIYKGIASFVPPQATADFENATKTAELILKRGISISVAFADDLPIPFGVVVLHKSADLESKFTEIVTKIDNDAGKPFEERTLGERMVKVISAPDATPGLELGWWTEGGHLVLAVGINAVQAAVDIADGKAKNITTNPLFASRAKNPAEFETIADAWLNVAPLRDKFGAIEFPIGDPQAGKTTTINKVLELLGVDTLGSVAMRSGIKERAMWSEVFIDAPAPRKGLLAFANQKSITINDLPPIPGNCAGFMLSSFDLGEAYDTILKLVKDIATLNDETIVEQIDGGLAHAEQFLGFNMKTDLLDSLGHVSCFYSDAGQGPLGFGFGIAVSVDDAAKVRFSLDKILNLAQQEAGPNLQVAKAQKQDREVITLQIGGGFVNPALCVDDKWLLLTLSPQSIDTFLMRLDKKLPSWKGGGDYEAALGVVPKEFISLSVSDPRVSVQSTMTMVNTMGPAMIAAARQEAKRQLQENAPQFPEGNPLADLPPAELITAPLFPNVSWCTVNETGVLVRERTSLPSMLGVAGVPAAGVGVALLLPAVQQARAAARRVQSMNNLKQIGLALHNYADVYKHFPEGARPNVDLAQEKLLSWQVEILPYIDQGSLYDSIDRAKAWDDEVNKKVLQTAVPVYIHPSAPPVQKNGYATTNYVGFAGLGKDGPTLPVDNAKAGIFAYNRSTRFADITDGTSYTAMVTETNSDVGPWGAAGKSTIRPVTQQPYINGPDGFGGLAAEGMNVLFADGSVHFVARNVDPKVFEAMITIHGGEVNPKLNP